MVTNKVATSTAAQQSAFTHAHYEHIARRAQHILHDIYIYTKRPKQNPKYLHGNRRLWLRTQTIDLGHFVYMSIVPQQLNLHGENLSPHITHNLTRSMLIGK